jgi:hypothetical protein
MPYHRRGYKLRSRQIRHLDSIAKHLAFLALTDNLPRAVRLFEKHLAEAMMTSNRYNRMRFLIDTLPLLDRLKKSGKSAVKLRLPAECPLSANGITHSVGDVRKWMHETAADLAQTFDRRNGNDYYSKRLAAAPRLQRVFAPCPLGR